MFKAATRVLFHLTEPINLVDFSQLVASGNQNRVEPGDYELEEVVNPYGGSLDAVTWWVVVKNDKATTIGTSLPNWESHGSFPEDLP